ncbi:MAG: cbb3-type cytochrome oxidase assembly protein CcoS [Bacteroidota bacterium]
MSVIIVLILVSFGMALSFLGAFIWAVSNNQYEDTFTPSVRILADDKQTVCEIKTENKL